MKDVYICFIDYNKTFYCVNHKELIKFPQEKEIHDNDMNFITQL